MLSKYLVLSVSLYPIFASKSFGSICLRTMLGELCLVLPSKSTLQIKEKKQVGTECNIACTVCICDEED